MCMKNIAGHIRYFVLLILLILCAAHENHDETGQDSEDYHAKSSNERNHLLAHIADRMDLDGEGLRHIQKHLKDVAGNYSSSDVEDIEKGDNQKGMFYFFKLHDYDNNNKLDGLELMSALSDFHHEDTVKDEKEGGEKFLEDEVVKIADELLEKHDLDRDGMIDYAEMMNTEINSLMTELDKNDELSKQQQHQQQQEQQKQQ
ncbi:cell growth regulator with EF hand domain protein 1 [Exaiptasia diaphana]|uniref:EF-hand domain-containing protein n=1 Tax=Exaiptasia diaphana TaxID=2652724 RepID=A0A913X8Z3_EXADI|nr:cell growth regulator with EF hand domain protein 1 [Exaiptasia diaphana]KXJ14043.1 Cell growth regulator with EF hand domain protein 1 [Exaiptasia diaphana]